MVDKEKVIDYLKKAKEYISTEPDKCLIYIELAERRIKYE